jgi:putative oxidoreductase
MNELDTASLILRLVLGVTLIAHGWNHGFGPGGLKGTTGWFESIGLRPAKVHAAVSSYLELAAGAALLVGFLVPLAAAAGVGIMTVAFVTVHRKNGFFIFREGEGY